jgi:hypothetical protein
MNLLEWGQPLANLPRCAAGRASDPTCKALEIIGLQMGHLEGTCPQKKTLSSSVFGRLLLAVFELKLGNLEWRLN